MKFSKPTWHDVRSILILLLGCAITAYGISAFQVPNKIAAGGVTGLATVIYYWTGWPVGIISLGLNLPLFLIGFRLIGGSFGFRTLLATITLSLLIDFFAGIPSVTDDLLLACLAGGALTGFGLGLVFRQDATTGGTDLAARILHRSLPHISIAQVLLAIDVLVVLTATFSFRSYELGLYAVVTVVVTTKVIEMVTLGINFTKAVHIISNRPEEVSKRLLVELNRGVTGLEGKGMWTGERKEVLVCVLTARQVPRLKRIVKEIDPDAFVYISDAREVFGEGFHSHE